MSDTYELLISSMRVLNEALDSAGVITCPRVVVLGHADFAKLRLRVTASQSFVRTGAQMQDVDASMIVDGVRFVSDRQMYSETAASIARAASKMAAVVWR